MVPDDGPRAKRNRLIADQQLPADIDVVARGAMGVIKAADFQQRVSAKRHVAARDMLGRLVVEEHMCGIAGSKIDAGRCETVAWRGQIWPAHSRRLLLV